MSEQLPVCVLCGEEPEYYGLLVGCSKPCCDLRAALMSASDWRRLMARPRLAPEHVETLRQWANVSANLGYDSPSAAIRAALAALGEE